ncbi:MAG: oligosaccharide flippase family protein [Gammaproteobacteria bacterium]|nr:oligosaccharide flippase family protein [Gammaproteobacteria bacterium]MBU2058444.1 oligosaccharide flippase family protein [Gammaproteobacteria bacterium]MBU2176503.1 oligosaccharide flippase family protein [Gammaproteobacteria bacterium]MBU2248555.1 oligosaccharide flippase family protein [Gammaproteobacteria bacterium]MBU2345582.1 oligosaccharide flippase family protein [Gammaproteobacteria bacterium]
MAQAIPIIAIPILTRIYRPEDFGVLALFVSITAILGAVANARYEIAITQAASELNSFRVAVLGLLICSVFSILLIIPFIIFNDVLVSLVGNAKISVWLYFVPITVWFIGIYNVFNFLSTRRKSYKEIAASHIFRSVSMVSLQSLLGLLKFGASGLIIGHIVSHIASIFSLTRSIVCRKLFITIFDFKKIKVLACRYKKFPIFMLPATIMNSISNNMLSITIPTLFSLSTLGHYSLAQRALGAPSAIIGNSIAQVYLQQASKEKQETGSVIKSFNSTLLKLLAVSVCIFAPAYFFVEPVFEFVFGQDWLIAGTYCKILIPYFSVNFVVSALSYTDSIMGKQYLYAAFNFILIIGLLLILIFFDIESIYSFLHIVVGYLVATYLLYLMLLRKVAKN